MVLTWHSVSDGPAPLCQYPDRLAAQLDLFADAGYQVVSLAISAFIDDAGLMPRHRDASAKLD